MKEKKHDMKKGNNNERHVTEQSEKRRSLCCFSEFNLALLNIDTDNKGSQLLFSFIF